MSGRMQQRRGGRLQMPRSAVRWAAWAMLALAGMLSTLGAIRTDRAAITVDPRLTYQTITGWEATAQAGHAFCAGFPNYADQVFDQAVHDLGINRVRVEVRNGAEHPIDVFSRVLNWEIGHEGWRKERFVSVNDDADPFHINPAGFHFSEVDNAIDRVALPLKRRLEARGERLFVNVNYVDFGQSAFEHRDHSEEYAEFVLATYLHLQARYGWVPDAWEVSLEADNAGWSGAQLGRAMVAAGRRLEAHGFRPRFIAPSSTDMTNALITFDEIVKVPGALNHLEEISYHRYAGVTDASLRGIASRAERYGLRTSMLEHIGSGYHDLHEDLKVGRNSAWAQYTLAGCSNHRWPAPQGQVDEGGAYFLVDDMDVSRPIVKAGYRTPALRQYFQYVRSGATRIDATSDNGTFDPLAFINPDGSNVVLIKASRGGDVGLRGLPAGTYGVRSVVDGRVLALPDVTIGDGAVLEASIPHEGVLTVHGRP